MCHEHYQPQLEGRKQEDYTKFGQHFHLRYILIWYILFKSGKYKKIHSSVSYLQMNYI